MGANRQPKISKRQRELSKKRKQQEKAAKMARRRQSRDYAGDDAPPNVDPDIAHIVPGPQPQPWMEDDDGGSEEARAQRI